jgi:parallel beta-helix repeat protein
MVPVKRTLVGEEGSSTMHARPVGGWAARVAAAALAAALLAAGRYETPAPGPDRVEVRVGIDEGDIRGADHRALQAAVDHVARLGGGTVRIGPGCYLLRNALTLRDNVRVCGVPGKTVLAVCDGARSRLSADGDCNERQVTLEDASAFRVGDGIAVRDTQSASGFTVTTATLTARVDEHTFRISAPLYLDYLVSLKATAHLAFPAVGGWGVRNAAVEGVTVAGNRARAEHVDGCRAGGIYLFECDGVTVRDCVVRDYNGDGISFQVSRGVTVEGCLCEHNAGLGLHPGSGSQAPVVRHNRSLNNGGDGLFVCWRVQHGLFEGNEVRGNQGAGVSIGHKDTDNVFRDNTITGNGRAGVLFRAESEPMGAHRNVFECNRILDNGAAEPGEAAGAAVVVRGPHHGLVFRGNTLGSSSPGQAAAGILADKAAGDLQAEGNQYLHVKEAVRRKEP